MTRRVPAPQETIIDKAGRGTTFFINFLRSVSVEDDSAMVADLSILKPTAGRRIFVIDDISGHGVPCYGDGTNWRRYSDNSVVV